MSRIHPSYAPEYRRQMVELVHAGRTSGNWLESTSALRRRFATGCVRPSATRVVERTV